MKRQLRLLPLFHSSLRFFFLHLLNAVYKEFIFIACMVLIFVSKRVENKYRRALE